MTEGIKSLDELREKDVIEVEYSPTCRVLGVIKAIGDVPEHEREILFHRLYPPETPDRQVGKGFFTIRESSLIPLGVVKLRREDYEGWKYSTVERL